MVPLRVFLILSLAVVSTVKALTPSRNAIVVEGAKEGFLYAGTNDSYPVLDYEAAPNDTNPDRPAFLYSPNAGPRVVEFYAPWCPHCKRFRTHYIDMARRVAQLVNNSNADFNVSFYAVSCTVHRPICKDFKITGYPQVKILKAGSSEPVANEHPKELHPFEIMNILGGGGSSSSNDFLTDIDFGEEMAAQSTSSLRSKVLGLVVAPKPNLFFQRTKRQTFEDAYLSFDFSMRTLFVSDGPLEVKPKKALKEWLDLLKKTMPPAWKIQPVIEAILDDFDAATSDEKSLLKILDRFQKTESEWSPSCTKGQSGMGFTCGLWELFHIMSVGMLEWNALAKDKSTMITAARAAQTLRDFIEFFFRCEECRINFLKAYEDCSLDRCERLTAAQQQPAWKQLPLWLLETHNAVNLRLMEEDAKAEGRTPSDKDALNTRWPSEVECPKCWNEDGTYDEDIALKHLRIEYWPEDAVTESHREELGEFRVIRMVDEGGTLGVPPIFLNVLVVAFSLACLTFFYRKLYRGRKKSTGFR